MIDSSLETTLLQKGYVITPIKGASMLPLLKEGRDQVVIKQIKNPIRKGDVLLYVRPDGTHVLHRVYKATKNFLVMCGDNQTILEYNVRFDAVLGVLDGIYSGRRYINVNKSLKYKLYKTFWGGNRNFRAFINNLKKLVKKIIKKG